MSEHQGHFEEAIRQIFAAHEEDPRRIEVGGRSLSWSVFYHERMRAWLEKLAPSASEPLRLAVSCQHLRRWKIPREQYPTGKIGYKGWRRDLARLHGDEAAEILEACGYGSETTQRVRELLLKMNLKTDPESQTLEDVACLVFLEIEFAAFAERHDDDKLVVILRKTWQKMSPAGREEAAKLAGELPGRLRRLVARAVG